MSTSAMKKKLFSKQWGEAVGWVTLFVHPKGRAAAGEACGQMLGYPRL
jgi:hypothetical protein